MIVDASVALKWVIEEADSASADRLFDRDDLAAPEHLRIEAAYALTRRVRRRDLTAADAREAWMTLLDAPLSIVADDDTTDAAFDLSLRLHANLYDCVYLALALARDDTLVTADEAFVRAVQADRRLAPRVRLLSQVAP